MNKQELTTINVPVNGQCLMFNGYMSPYSQTGHDWMEDAIWVMKQEYVTEELQMLVDDYAFHYRQLNEVQHPAIDEHYREFIQKEIALISSKLLALGYTVNMVDNSAHKPRRTSERGNIAVLYMVIVAIFAIIVSCCWEYLNIASLGGLG